MNVDADSIRGGDARQRTAEDYRGLREGPVTAEVWSPAEAELRASGLLDPFPPPPPPGRPVLRGRGSPYRLEIGPVAGEVVVRRCLRGGLIRLLSRERYLGRGRVARELAAFRRLEAAGVPTPRLVAAISRSAGPGLYRHVVVTRFLPDAPDLAALLETLPPADPRRAGALRAAGEATAAMHRAGVTHGDLNLKNILLPAEGSGFQGSVIDLGLAALSDGPADGRGDLARFVRSAAKMESSGLAIADEELAAFVSAYVSVAGPAHTGLVKGLWARRRSAWALRRPFWGAY